MQNKVNNTDNFLKETFAKVPFGDTEKFRTDLSSRMRWNNRKWLNRYNGDTTISEAEKIIIQDFFQAYLNQQEKNLHHQ